MPPGKNIVLKETAFATIPHNFYDFALFPFSFPLVTSSIYSLAAY